MEFGPPQVEREFWHKAKHPVYRVWVHVDNNRFVSGVYRYHELRELHCALKKGVEDYNLRFPSKTLLPSNMLSKSKLEGRAHKLDRWVQMAEATPAIVLSDAWTDFFHLPKGTDAVHSHLARENTQKAMQLHAALTREPTAALLAAARRESMAQPYVPEAFPEELGGVVDMLRVDRSGSVAESYMVTDRIASYSLPGHKYVLKPTLGGRRFTLTEADMDAEGEASSGTAGAGVPRGPAMLCPELSFVGLPRREAPPHATFHANWFDPKDPSAELMLKAHVDSGRGTDANSNILGKNGKLLMSYDPADTSVVLDDDLTVHVPWVWATDKALQYYGARLVDATKPFEFSGSAPLPVAHMRIGSGYVDGYIKKLSLGGGFYLEHHITPHFHLPRDRGSSGYLILAKVEGGTGPGLQLPTAERQEYSITAFRIPFGFAVYSGPRVIHNDSYLVGAYSVVYTVTDDFSTAMLRWPDDRKATDGSRTPLGPVVVTVDAGTFEDGLEDAAGLTALTPDVNPHDTDFARAEAARLREMDDSSSFASMSTPMSTPVPDSK